jgi:hypothetical protein
MSIEPAVQALGDAGLVLINRVLKHRIKNLLLDANRICHAQFSRSMQQRRSAASKATPRSRGVSVRRGRAA